MDVLSEAKEKGIIRAHGCSCHSIEALRAATKSSWSRSISSESTRWRLMDSNPDTVVSVIRQMRAPQKASSHEVLGQVSSVIAR